VEKRTLFEKSLAQVLNENEAAAASVAKAAEATTQDVPILTYFLPPIDKWHVLNAALNQVSAVHAPYYMHADICPDQWKAEWYVIAMVCDKHEAPGRRFAGGRPEGDDPELLEAIDIRNTKVRIVCVKEVMLQHINEGLIVPPAPQGWQNARHRSRWQTISIMAQLYKQQHEEPHNSSSRHLLRLSIAAPVAAARDSLRRGSVDSGANRTWEQYTSHPLVQARLDKHKGRSWADPLSAYGGWDAAVSELTSLDEVSEDRRYWNSDDEDEDGMLASNHTGRAKTDPKIYHAPHTAHARHRTILRSGC